MAADETRSSCPATSEMGRKEKCAGGYGLVEAVTQAHQDPSPQASESTTLPRSCPPTSKPGLPATSKPGKMLSFYSGANKLSTVAISIAAMRALDAGATTGEIARKYQVSPHLLGRWRGRLARQGRFGIPRNRPSRSFLAGRRRCPSHRRVGAQDRLTHDGERFLKESLVHFREHHPPAVVNGGDACLKKSSKPRRKGKP
jgi:transposase-like protein